MRRTIGRTLCGLACLSFFAMGDCAAQTEVRPYSNPGYTRIGVYGGGPRKYFDYNQVRHSLGDTFPNKKQWWERSKATYDAGKFGSNHDVWRVYCGERRDTLEKCIQRVDAWLKSEPGIKTYPEIIPAVCLGEENQSINDVTLEGLARHIRDNYGIAVMQWYTYPAGPNTNLTADGWLLDAYGMGDVQFRKHLMKFVSLGKPVMHTAWASDPHWPNWTQYPNTAALVNNEWHQFQACMEFNVTAAVFAVAGPGAMNPWLSSGTPEMIKLRNWLRTKRAEIRAFKPGDLPLASANFSARDRTVPVGGDSGSPSVYDENFSDFGWIHDANLTGFLDMRLTSRPQTPGFLLARTDKDRPVEATLVYRFESYFPLKTVKVTLDAEAPKVGRCRNEIALSYDDLSDDWTLQSAQQGTDGIETIASTANSESLQNRRVFYVRVRMTNHADEAGQQGNRLDRLRIECVHQEPSEGAAAALVRDGYGNLSYDDDFSTTRWQHLGGVTAAHKNHGGYEEGRFWVGMVGGFTTSTHVIQRLSTPQELKDLTVSLQARVNTRNLGGHLDLGIAPRGGKIQWRTSTDGKPRGVYNGLTLKVDSEDLKSLRDFDVHIVLRSTSGVEGGRKECASVSTLRIRGK